ncbi:unnamed protein product [Rhizophagus irregularis]|nr:unnamed protein product [Rhizophagus irregularis]
METFSNGLVSKNLEIQKTVFLVGDSFGFLKHEFDGFLSGGFCRFSQLLFRYCQFSGFCLRSTLQTHGILKIKSLDAGFSGTREIVKLAPAWKPKSQASNASLDGFIWDVNFSID